MPAWVASLDPPPELPLSPPEPESPPLAQPANSAVLASIAAAATPILLARNVRAMGSSRSPESSTDVPTVSDVTVCDEVHSDTCRVPLAGNFRLPTHAGVATGGSPTATPAEATAATSAQSHCWIQVLPSSVMPSLLGIAP
ncbi:hypothetical protein GCM10023353_05580 [Tomitella cavernea]|uniref:Uncharacterized protein n=1 Tax=Tomitella cavernea TaxID=1387982 RepID=A0ABP9C8F6_9ACTN